MTEHESLSPTMSALLRVSHKLHQARDLDTVLDLVLKEARRLAGADAGTIYLVHDQKWLGFDYFQNNTLQKRDPHTSRFLYSRRRIPIDHNSLAGHVALTGKALLIQDVDHLPEDRPYHFDPRPDLQGAYRTRTLFTQPLTAQDGKTIGVLQILNPLDRQGKPCPFDPQQIQGISILATLAAGAIEQARFTRDLIVRMLRMAQMRDPEETGTHVQRVAAYTVELYQAWSRTRGLPEEESKHVRDHLRIAAMLHDVGKIGISDTILKKSSPLTDREFEQMKTHTTLGAALFMPVASEWDALAASVAQHHHQRWDGSGYPLPSLKGEAIPLPARLVAIADVFDALTTGRSYKQAWTVDQAIDEIRRLSGKAFDPELVGLFLEIKPVVGAIHQKYLDTESSGIRDWEAPFPPFGAPPQGTP